MMTLDDEEIQDTTKKFKVKEKPIYSFTKRVFDIGASFVGLTLLSPVLLGAAIAIKLESKGPDRKSVV